MRTENKEKTQHETPRSKTHKTRHTKIPECVCMGGGVAGVCVCGGGRFKHIYGRHIFTMGPDIIIYTNINMFCSQIHIGSLFLSMIVVKTQK